MIGWVLFRADTFAAAGHFARALSGLGHAPDAQPLPRYLSNQALWAIALGIPFSTPLWDWIKTTSVRLGQAVPASCRAGAQIFGGILDVALVVGLLLISAIWLAGATYNPFIYFRF